MCGGGGGPPPPPGPTATEEALRQKQIDLLNEQQRMQEAWSPIQAEQLGYTMSKTPVQIANPAIAAAQKELDQFKNVRPITPNGNLYSVNGNTYTLDDLNAALYEKQAAMAALPKTVDGSDYSLTYTKTPERIAQDKQLADLQSLQLDSATKSNKAINDYLDYLSSPEQKALQAKQTEIDAQQQDITLQQGERQKLALAGKLPVSQGTVDRKAQEFAALKETLARSGNNIIGDDPSTAYALSSPGSQALDLFNRRYGAIEDQERQGTLDSSAQSYLQSVGLAGDIGNKTMSYYGSTSGPGAFGATSPSYTNGSPSSNYLSLSQGYGAAAQPYAQDRANAYQYLLAGYLPGSNGAAGAAGGALSGAATGTAILPGWGTALGALGGGIAGYFGTKG